jgi:hypothetical protein
MIHARVALAEDFKRCCMLSGEFDGSDRHYFFQIVRVVSYQASRAGDATCLGSRCSGPDQLRGRRGTSP